MHMHTHCALCSTGLLPSRASSRLCQCTRPLMWETASSRRSSPTVLAGVRCLSALSCMHAVATVTAAAAAWCSPSDASRACRESDPSLPVTLRPPSACTQGAHARRCRHLSPSGGSRLCRPLWRQCLHQAGRRRRGRHCRGMCGCHAVVVSAAPGMMMTLATPCRAQRWFHWGCCTRPASPPSTPFINHPQVHDGALFVNGVPRTEPFIYERPAYTLAKLVVPPGDVRAVVVATAARCWQSAASHDMDFAA